MSQVGYTVVQASAFAATAGAKTALLALAGANAGLLVVEFGISFDGVTASAVPALVELVSTTAATAGTSGETPTITQTRGRVTGGEPPTGGSKYSAEPTVLVRHKAWYVSPNGGLLVVQFPLGREPETDDSGGTIRGYGIRVNVSANVNVMSYLEVEKNG
jgi:hypothetical protein